MEDDEEIIVPESPEDILAKDEDDEDEFGDDDVPMTELNFDR